MNSSNKPSMSNSIPIPRPRTSSNSRSKSIPIPVPLLQRAASRGEAGNVITEAMTYIQPDDARSWEVNSPLVERSLKIEEDLLRTKGRSSVDSPVPLRKSSKESVPLRKVSKGKDNQGNNNNKNNSNQGNQGNKNSRNKGNTGKGKHNRGGSSNSAGKGEKKRNSKSRARSKSGDNNSTSNSTSSGSNSSSGNTGSGRKSDKKKTLQRKRDLLYKDHREHGDSVSSNDCMDRTTLSCYDDDDTSANQDFHAMEVQTRTVLTQAESIHSDTLDFHSMALKKIPSCLNQMLRQRTPPPTPQGTPQMTPATSPYHSPIHSPVLKHQTAPAPSFSPPPSPTSSKHNKTSFSLLSLPSQQSTDIFYGSMDSQSSVLSNASNISNTSHVSTDPLYCQDWPDCVQVIHLYKNKLSKLTSVFETHLQNIETLTLGFNHFATFPIELYYHPRLQHIDLSNNQIATLPSKCGVVLVGCCCLLGEWWC